MASLPNVEAAVPKLSARRARQRGDLVASLNRHVPGLVRLCFYRPDSTESHEYVISDQTRGCDITRLVCGMTTVLSLMCGGRFCADYYPKTLSRRRPRLDSKM